MIARATIACAVVALAVSAAGADAVVGQNAFVGSCPSESPPEIYSVGADGSLRTNLTRNTAFDAGPAVSPTEAGSPSSAGVTDTKPSTS